MEVLNTKFPWGITEDRKVKTRLGQLFVSDIPSIVDRLHYDYFKCVVNYEAINVVVNEIAMNFYIVNNGKEHNFEEFDPRVLYYVSLYILTETIIKGYAVRPQNFQRAFKRYNPGRVESMLLRETLGELVEFAIKN